MSKITPDQLLNNKGVEELVYNVISNSISYGIIKIAERAVKSEKIMREIGSSIKKIVKIYENPDLNLISEKERDPIPKLMVFWKDTSFITKYEFEKLDKELLVKGLEYPIELINQISKKSQTYGKTELYKKSIGLATKDIEYLLNHQNRK